MGAAAMDRANMGSLLRSKVMVNRRRNKVMGSTHLRNSTTSSNTSSTTSRSKVTVTLPPNTTSSSSTSGPKAPLRRAMMRTDTPLPTGRDTEVPGHRALPRPRLRAPRSSATEHRKVTLSSTPTARVAVAPC